MHNKFGFKFGFWTLLTIVVLLAGSGVLAAYNGGQVQDTGWISCTNIQENPGKWGLPKLACEEDGNYTYSHHIPYDNRVVSVGGFPFAIPEDAEILGIEIKIVGHLSAPRANPNYLEVEFYSMGRETQTSPMSREDAAYILGSPTSLWGTTWEASQFNAPDFFVKVIWNRAGYGGWTRNTVYVDSVQMRLHYIGKPQPSATPTPSPTPMPTATPTPIPTFIQELQQHGLQLVKREYGHIVLYVGSGCSSRGWSPITDPQNIPALYGFPLSAIPELSFTSQDDMARQGYSITSKSHIRASQIGEMLENIKWQRENGMRCGSSQPVPAPDVSSSDLAELAQLVADIKTLTENQPNVQVLGSIAGDAYPYHRIRNEFAGFQQDLGFGAKHSDIKDLQRFLNADPDTQVAQTGPGSPDNETDEFGPLTKDAVCRFQTKYKQDVLAPAGLKACTGYVGQYTRVKLNQLLQEEREKARKLLTGEDSEIARQLRANREAEAQFWRDIWDAMTLMPGVGAIQKTARTVQEVKTAEAVLRVARQKLTTILAALKSPRPREALGDALIVSRGLAKQTKIDLATLGKVARTDEEVARLAKYIDEGGDEAVRYVQEMVGISKVGVQFRGIGHSWITPRHRMDFEALGIKNETQLSELIHGPEGIIKGGKKGIQRYRDGPVKDQFIFVKEMNFPTGVRQWIYIVADKTGEVVDAYPVSVEYFLRTSDSRTWLLELY